MNCGPEHTNAFRRRYVRAVWFLSASPVKLLQYWAQRWVKTCYVCIEVHIDMSKKIVISMIVWNLLKTEEIAKYKSKHVCSLQHPAIKFQCRLFLQPGKRTSVSNEESPRLRTGRTMKVERDHSSQDKPEPCYVKERWSLKACGLKQSHHAHQSENNSLWGEYKGTNAVYVRLLKCMKPYWWTDHIFTNVPKSPLTVLHM